MLGHLWSVSGDDRGNGLMGSGGANPYKLMNIVVSREAGDRGRQGKKEDGRKGK